MLNLVFLTCSSPQILYKTHIELFRISRFLVKALMSKSCLNSRTDKDIVMKYEQNTKLDKKNLTSSTLCWKIMMLSSFFQFMVDLKPFETWNLTYSLISTFYVTKSESRTKKALTQLS